MSSDLGTVHLCDPNLLNGNSPNLGKPPDLMEEDVSINNPQPFNSPQDLLTSHLDSSHPTESFHHPVSFLDAVKGTLSPSDIWTESDFLTSLNGDLDKLDLESDEVTADPSIPIVRIDSETRKRISQPWTKCIIGKVMGKT
ncbi:hypothetical protein MKX03_028898, partial [Papaver bracteatum]